MPGRSALFGSHHTFRPVDEVSIDIERVAFGHYRVERRSFDSLLAADMFAQSLAKRRNLESDGGRRYFVRYSGGV